MVKCGSKSCSKTRSMGCSWSARCLNITFIPFGTSNGIVFLIELRWINIRGFVSRFAAFLNATFVEIIGKFPYHWFAVKIFRLRFIIGVSNDTRRNGFKVKCWVMSVTDLCDVMDDVLPSHVKIGTCGMLSVLPCIRIILNRRLLLKPSKGPHMLDFVILLSKHNNYCGTATQ